MSFLHALELASTHGWLNLWVEGDSTGALVVFKDKSLIPWQMRNRWNNVIMFGLHVVSSHIFREGNCCADKLANQGHSI